MRYLKDVRFLNSRLRIWGGGDMEKLDKIIIFLHGSGISAFGMEKWLRSVWQESPPRGSCIVLPSAPMRPYLLEQGRPTSVWHQRRVVDINEDEEDWGLINNIN